MPASTRTQRTALELGAWSFDAAARSLALGESRRRPRADQRRGGSGARSARRTHARGGALWLRGGDAMAALRSVIAAFDASGRHLEASLWFMGCGLFVLAVALVCGGRSPSCRGRRALPHAAHDLGHLLPRPLPELRVLVRLAALLLLPLALGEGALGFVLAALAVAGIYGGRAQRAALCSPRSGSGSAPIP